MFRFALLLPFLLGYCKDETLSGHGAAEQVFVLQSINDLSFPARATIAFPEEGKIIGEAPCNTYSASQDLPYPWFKAGPILATKRACPDLSAETEFFETLARMTLSEVSGKTLILSTSEGETMIFEGQ